MIIQRADLWRGSAGTALRDPYGRQVAAMADGAMVSCCGDYLVAVSHGHPQGRYEPLGGGLTWRKPAPDRTVRLDIAVADADDGRFVPGLTVYVAPEGDRRTHAPSNAPSTGIPSCIDTPRTCASSTAPTTSRCASQRRDSRGSTVSPGDGTPIPWSCDSPTSGSTTLTRNDIRAR